MHYGSLVFRAAAVARFTFVIEAMKISIRKSIYVVEIIFVAIPAALFLLLSWPWMLGGLQLKAWGPTVVVFALWLGGIGGIVGLVQLFVWLVSEKRFEIEYLWLKLFVGATAAAFPTLFIFSGPDNGGSRNGFLLFLLPVAVAAHWVWEYFHAQRQACATTQGER